VKVLILLLASSLLLLAQEREGNFTIRFEPKAILQTGVPIPFEISVSNDLQQPVVQATVTLQIETTAHENVKVFKAPSVSAGVYVAKPVFPSSGDWTVYVEVRRSGAMSNRTNQYNVPETPK